jgi:peptide chain release factor 1
MLDKLKEIEERYQELEKQLSDPSIVSDQNRYREVSKEYKDMEKVVAISGRYQEVLKQIAEDQEVVKQNEDQDLVELAKAELEGLHKQQQELEEELKVLLLPRDENDTRNAIVEIRAGTGGEEAGLFAADLYRMYGKYAERQRWKLEVMSSNPTGIGGLKEMIFMVSGEDVFSRLKFESGVHRVQRIPVTESGGRIHTSAVSVAILPEAEEVDVDLDSNDIKMDVYRSSGPGGQSVNTTDSAVRLTHLSTGLVVTCQDEKSQHKNRAKAMKILAARLLDKKRGEQQNERAANRKLQVGTGDRSEKIRTYNFPQNRITDHRISYTAHNLDQVLEGDLDALLEVLQMNYQQEQLAATGEEEK